MPEIIAEGEQSVSSERLQPQDQTQLAELAIDVNDVLHQLRLFEGAAPYLALDRPCTVGDGIRVLSEAEAARAQACAELASGQGRVQKFVPASGAASRMFQALLAARSAEGGAHRAALVARAAQGDKAAAECLQFAGRIRDFAFFDGLSLAVRRRGQDIDVLVARGAFGDIFDCLLTDRGLGYGNLPKGLLLFHRYPQGPRTAFEEHLVEAAGYTRDQDGTSRLHFTVSPEHEQPFITLLDVVGATYKRATGARFEVGFSHQKRCTDTLAVDLANSPVRSADGRLLFRPGGHGALIENLNDLRGDVVAIKNIDNVAAEHLQELTVIWKKILIGHLVATQARVFRYLTLLREETTPPELVAEAADFARSELCLAPDPELSLSEQRRVLADKLDRPIRVCGVVRHTGEPGGGPFWVRSANGTTTLQIVEQAQVDAADRAQQEVFASATHFNPVDLVCGVSNAQGHPFDLKRFVDSDAVFIAQKFKDGRPIKVLERPGLWNGAMARWNTIFIEVPSETFNPVKTVTDLLRPAHQPVSRRLWGGR
jgi:hypothetical protein